VCADPAEAGVARQGFLQNRRAVDADPVTKWPNALLYGERKLRKRPAHELVIVAAERVTRHVGEISIRQDRRRILRILGPVVHAHADHAHGAGRKLMRPAAHAAVVMHIVHLAVMARGEPVLQMPLVAGKLDIGDPERVKSMRARERLQILFSRSAVQLR